MHIKQFMFLLYDMIRKLLACFYPLKVLCNTSFVNTITRFSSFFFYFSYFLFINVIYLGYFSKMETNMNVNSGIFYLITDRDNCERCTVIYMILHI